LPAPIVVEVYAPQPGPQELAVLLAACTRAAAPNDCVTSESKGNEAPLGVAIVHRDGQRARIELGLRSSANAEWSTRDLVFQPGDDELERCRAIGFAIGTLVAHKTEPAAAASTALPPSSSSSPASESPRASPPPRARPTPEQDEPSRPAKPAPERRSRATWVDVAGGVGLGLIPGPPRAGGSLRAASELVPRGFFAVAETSYTERSGDPSLRVRWLSMALGVGHPLAPDLRSLGVDVRLLVAIERLSFTAADGERTAGASRWKPGVTTAIDGHWDFAPPLSLVLSAATFIDPERSVVRVGGQDAGETPALGLSGFVGVRLKLR
jgi:hypothetical protein